MMDKAISYEGNGEYNCGMVKIIDVGLSESSSISLLDLLNDMLLEITSRVKRDSYISFVHAKFTCKLLKSIGEEVSTLNHTSLHQQPLIVDEEYFYLFYK